MTADEEISPLDSKFCSDNGKPPCPALGSKVQGTNDMCKCDPDKTAVQTKGDLQDEHQFSSIQKEQGFSMADQQKWGIKCVPNKELTCSNFANQASLGQSPGNLACSCAPEYVCVGRHCQRDSDISDSFKLYHMWHKDAYRPKLGIDTLTATWQDVAHNRNAILSDSSTRTYCMPLACEALGAQSVEGSRGMCLCPKIASTFSKEDMRPERPVEPFSLQQGWDGFISHCDICAFFGGIDDGTHYCQCPANTVCFGSACFYTSPIDPKHIFDPRDARFDWTFETSEWHDGMLKTLGGRVWWKDRDLGCLGDSGHSLSCEHFNADPGTEGRCVCSPIEIQYPQSAFIWRSPFRREFTVQEAWSYPAWTKHKHPHLNCLLADDSDDIRWSATRDGDLKTVQFKQPGPMFLTEQVGNFLEMVG